MLIAIIRAHFSAQHAASEDKELSTSTHKVAEKERKTEREKDKRGGETRKCLEKDILLLAFLYANGIWKSDTNHSKWKIRLKCRVNICKEIRWWRQQEKAEWGSEGSPSTAGSAFSLCVLMMMLTLCWFTNANTIKCDKWQHNLLREALTVSSSFLSLLSTTSSASSSSFCSY